ncbi:MAG: helicase, partial [Chloroflexales bacterium]|nr:helicase [Chloroflexales bacterium]
SDLLGITAPLPVESGTVVETLIASLFQPAVEQLALFDTARQMTLLDAVQDVQDVETAWNRAVEREQESRTRFAQRRIKPEEVARELQETDAVLGDAAAVERFVSAACARLGAELIHHKGTKDTKARSEMSDLGALRVFVVNLLQLPAPVRERVAHLAGKNGELAVSFADPTPEGVESLGRNHALVIALADYLMETALAPDGAAPVAARSGAVRARAVQTRTRLLLLRVRMLIESTRQRAPVLAEELVAVGFSGQPGAPAWLSQPDALALLEQAQAAVNLTPDERTIALSTARDELPMLASELTRIAEERATLLRESHMRVRVQTGGGAVKVRPAGPPDVLGLYVLLPTLN